MPKISCNKVEKFDKETERKFQEKGGIKKKPRNEQIYEKIKADAVHKRNEAYLFPNELDKKQRTVPNAVGADGKPLTKQLPTDENGQLPLWDPTKIENLGNDYVCALFGKRRTGKTWLAREILYHKRGVFNHGLVITKTKFNGFWQNYFPKAVVHGTYDPNIIEQYMLLALEIEEYNRAHPDKQINNRSVIVLDDVIADKHVRYCDTLATLFYNGRHFGIFLIICSQYVFGLPPGLRSNTDIMASAKQFQKRQRDQLNEDFADFLENDDEFFWALDENTNDNHFIIIDISNPNNPIEKMFYTYKASDPGLFEIGSYIWKQQVWEEGEEKDKEDYTFN